MTCPSFQWLMSDGIIDMMPYDGEAKHFNAALVVAPSLSICAFNCQCPFRLEFIIMTIISVELKE